MSDERYVETKKNQQDNTQHRLLGGKRNAEIQLESDCPGKGQEALPASVAIGRPPLQ
jgi:hypothetical protein